MNRQGCFQVLTMSLMLVVVIAAKPANAADQMPSAASDPWSQGRPAEALPNVVATAEKTQKWHAWYDAGLCAAAAGERSAAVGYLWSARRLAPLRNEPIQALTVLAADAPLLWSDRLGPLAQLGQGWLGLSLALVAGILVGSGCLLPRQRTWLLTCGLVLTALIAPGAGAGFRDQHDPHRVTVIDTQLLDSTGSPIAAVPGGTIVEVSGDQWAGRWPVRLRDGRSGLIASSDLR